MAGEGGTGPRLIQHRLPLRLIVGMYGVMTAVAVGLSWWLLGGAPINVGTRELPVWASVIAGLAFGFLVVRASDVLTARSEVMRRMALKLRVMIGHVTPVRAAIIGLFSGVGEELLFRGFIFPYIARLALE
jgi:membrane protease YdiL (CAAX protease family)